MTYRMQIYADSVKAPVIFNKEFDINFCPVVGKVELAYNGSTVTIFIEGEYCILKSNSFSGSFQDTFVLEKIGKISWGEILKECLVKVLVNSTQTAMSEFIRLEHQRKESGSNVPASH